MLSKGLDKVKWLSAEAKKEAQEQQKAGQSKELSGPAQRLRLKATQPAEASLPTNSDKQTPRDDLLSQGGPARDQVVPLATLDERLRELRDDTEAGRGARRGRAVVREGRDLREVRGQEGGPPVDGHNRSRGAGRDELPEDEPYDTIDEVQEERGRRRVDSPLKERTRRDGSGPLARSSHAGRSITPSDLKAFALAFARKSRWRRRS